MTMIDPFRAEDTQAYKDWVAHYGEPRDYTDWEEISCGVSAEIRRNLDDLITRLETRVDVPLIEEAIVWLKALKGKVSML